MIKTHQQVATARKPARHKSNADRIVKTIAEERLRRDRRLLRLVTQHLKRPGVKQQSSSQLENRADMILSTLRSLVRKIGAELVVTVQFPDREPKRITAFADIARARRGKSRGKRGPSQSG